MFQLIALVTGFIILAGAQSAYKKARDAFHPAVVFAPTFLYCYSYFPIVLNMDGRLNVYFGDWKIIYVAVLYCLAIAAFYLGLLSKTGKQKAGQPRQSDIFNLGYSPSVRKNLYRLSIVLGAVSVAAYWYMLENVGGFTSAFSHAKGGGRASSGYIGEATLLSFPAILILALSRQGVRKLTFPDIVTGLIIVSPHLIQGTFGGRRGPLFLALSTLFFAWYLAKGKRPSLKSMLAGFAVIGFAVILMWSQRQDVYLGSGESFELSRVIQKLAPEKGGEGDSNSYAVGIASVLTADHFEQFYWGYRYFVTFFIRPVPKQIWPTKYEDMGADWLYRYEDDERNWRYFQATRFVPLAGSATGVIADVYNEFSWGAIIFLYFLGKGFSAIWNKSRQRGGVWTIVFVEMLILSIYLPTQSLTAWGTRFVFMAAITFVIWKWWIKDNGRYMHRTKAAP